MRNLKKGKILLIAIIATSFISISSNVKAAMQSRPNVSSKIQVNMNYFFEEIRKIETEGGALGKNAILDSTTFLDSTKNGVDVHMAKNTEWGTAAMLAASSYGQAGSGTITYDTEKTSGSATTGNATGIYQMADSMSEYVSGIYNNNSNSDISNIATADERYKDIYKSTISRPGDATTETSKWKGATTSGMPNFSWAPIFRRSCDSLFGFDSDSGAGTYTNRTSRAVLVLGAGL